MKKYGKYPSKKFQVKNFVTPEKTAYHAEILVNRIKKNFRHLSRRFKKQDIECFRLYDWDIAEVRAVVDWYAGHVVVAEYERLQTGPEWLPEMAKAVAKALELTPSQVHIKRRRTMTKNEPRYKRMNTKGERFEVRERDLKFWINPSDFLDTGLYSDHRDTRLMMRDMVKGKDFLNLFAYTGAFSCAAAAGGAKTTTTVDRSDTYIKWAKDNMQLNGFLNPKHTFIQSDVDKFLAQAQKDNLRFTFAFVDPPSFFKNRSTGESFDINQKHRELLENVLKVMKPGSTVIFSTNHQRFAPNFEGLAATGLTEITAKTIPEDYRNRTIHRCWIMTAA